MTGFRSGRITQAFYIMLAAVNYLSFARMRLTLLVLVFAALLSSLVLAQPSTSRPTYRAFDGKGNNLKNELWGAANTNFIRTQAPVGYASISSDLTGTDRPGARDISLALMATNYPDKQRFVAKHTSDMVTYIGQFFDHDLDKTMDGEEPAPIPIPKNDPFYNPNGLEGISMKFSRSAYDVDSTGYRQSINIITSFIDGSLVYGSSKEVADTLRAFKGGKMAMLEEDARGPLPTLVGATKMNVGRMANDANRVPPSTLRAIGDVRGNVNPPILTFHTLWLREHNRMAAELAAANPDWDDEKLYQEARKWTIAFLQNICFHEYVPALGIQLPAYTGYKADVNPSVDAFFSTVSYRYGHSEVTDVILRIDDDGNEIPQGHLLLHTAYFNPNVSLFAGIDPILRGLTVRVQGYVEPRFSQAVQQFLFGFPGVNGTDLFARNIQRARDHGIPDYNTCRKGLGLKPISTFAELTNNTVIADVLTKLYGTPDKCDAYVCGLAETKLPDNHFGPLFNASLTDQYLRTRDGDWYYYENTANGAFTTANISRIAATRLRDIILRNTNIKVLPADIWHVDPDQPWPTGTCNASSPNTTKITQQVELSNGAYSLSWKFVNVSGTEMAEITMSAVGTGWVGFGVAETATSGMVNADIVMGYVAADGTATLQDSWSTKYGAPQPDSTFPSCNSQTTLVSSSQVNGRTTITFRRPVDRSDVCDRRLVKDGPNNIIAAWNPTSDDLQASHMSNKVKAIVTLASSTSSSEEALLTYEEEENRQETITFRKHGILMTIAWCFMMPLAVICNRLKNYFSDAKPVQQAFFYMHIFFNVVAVALSAAGLGVPFAAEYHPPYQGVAFSHGKFGIAIMVLIFVQVLYPWFRPNPTPLTMLRRMWELGHTSLGWSIAVMGLVNISIGVKIYTEEFDPNVKFWGCLAGVPVCTLFVIANIVDRLNSQKARRDAAYKQNGTASEVAMSKEAAKGLPTTTTSDSE